MTFEEWLDEIEVYATRRERLFEDVDFEAVMTGDASCRFMQKRMYTWLEAAYNKGLEEGKKATQPPIQMPYDIDPGILQPTPRPPVWPNVASCSRCGINLSGVMGYVCNDTKCPTYTRAYSITEMKFGRKSDEGYNG